MKPNVKAVRIWVELSLILLVFVVHFLFLQTLFYVHGPHLSDVGLQAALLWQNGWVIEYPQAYDVGNYFKTHIVLWMPLVSFISQWIPMEMAGWFAVNAALWHVILALAVIMLYRQFDFNTRIGWILVLTLVGMQLSGLIMHIVYFPHFEIILSGLIIITLVQYADCIKSGGKRRWPFWMSFTALMCVREDAGFHLAAPVLVLWVLLMLQRKPQSTWLPYLKLGCLGVMASVSLLIVQKMFFPGDDALARMYVGETFLSHVSSELLYERLGIWATERADVIWPYVFLCVVALFVRCPYFYAGLLAYIPWMFVSITAVNSVSGSFAAYYPFPLIVTLLWPLVASRLARASNESESLSSYGRVIPLQLFVLAISIAGYCFFKPADKLLAYRHFVWPNYSYNTDAWGNALEEIKALKVFEPTVYDSYVMGLLPKELNLCSRIDFNDIRPVNAVVYYEGAWKDKKVARYLEEQALPYVHRFANTKLVLASRIPYRPELVPEVPLDIDLMPYIFEMPGSAVFEAVEGQGAGRKLVHTVDAPEGYINWGPYVPLGKRGYAVAYDIVANAHELALIFFDVYSDKSGVVQYTSWTPPALGVPISHRVIIYFESMHDSDAFQFRVGSQGKCHVEIIGVSYEPFDAFRKNRIP